FLSPLSRLKAGDAPGLELRLLVLEAALDCVSSNPRRTSGPLGLTGAACDFARARSIVLSTNLLQCLARARFFSVCSDPVHPRFRHTSASHHAKGYQGRNGNTGTFLVWSRV